MSNLNFNYYIFLDSNLDGLLNKITLKLVGLALGPRNKF